jgi:hypothetical protein
MLEHPLKVVFEESIPTPLTIVTSTSVRLDTLRKLVGLGGRPAHVVPIYGLWKGEAGHRITMFVDEDGEPMELPINVFATEVIRPVVPILGNAVILLGTAKLLDPEERDLDELG